MSDLATNKAAAVADRRVPRDVVDLVTIHETVLPLGAVICSAVGEFAGVTPDEMLAEIIRPSRFTAAEFDSLATVTPVDVPGLHRRIRGMIESAWAFIDHLPSEAVGVVYIDGDRCVQPVVALLETFTRNPGAPGGVWQSPPAIAEAI